MQHLTDQQLQALASSGVSNREIAALIGRSLSKHERATIDRVRGLLKVKRKAYKGTVRTRPEYLRESRERDRDVMRPRDASAPSARRSGDFSRPPAGDVEAWLLTYLPGAYPLPFGPVHRDIMQAFARAIATGQHVAIAAPRGTGKSALVNGLVLRALLERETDFPVVIPWDDRAKRRALRFWATELCFNARIHRDYEHATDAFRRSRGIANRLTALTENREATGARLGITEGVIVLPHGWGAIGSATINGNPRGLNYATIDGRIIRPSLAVVDDPQDAETARSKTLVEQTIERIDADVAGMAGPDQLMPVLATCTVIEREDVAEHYLSRQDWHTIRVGQVVTWPDGWQDAKSEARALWAQWDTLRLETGNDADLVAFYQANREPMTAGMSVSWAARYDAKRGQPDALYAAMYDFHRMGEDAFFSERQNAPIKRGVSVYTINADTVLARTTDRAPWSVPDWSVKIVCGCDVNPSKALTWVALALGSDQTAAIVAYGQRQLDARLTDAPAAVAAKVYGALTAVRVDLHARLAVDLVTYDARGWATRGLALRYPNRDVTPPAVPLTCKPAEGWPFSKYRPNNKTRIGQPFELCHEAADVVDGHRVRWLAWHADHWREIAQRAFTCEPGTPGSVTLPAGHHREFAQQVVSEQLDAKGDFGGVLTWRWTTLPGSHDYLDALAMAYMGAASLGIGTGGMHKQEIKVYKRRLRYVTI